MLVALALVSVFGIGGAKLKGKYNDTAKLYTAIDKYNNSIQSDFGTQVDAAANLIKQVGYLENAPTEALQDARVALEVWNNTAADPAAQYNANRDLYNAVDALYAAVNNKVDASTQQAINNQYNAFVSAQATIEQRGCGLQPVGGELRDDDRSVPRQCDFRFVGRAGNFPICTPISHDNKGKL